MEYGKNRKKIVFYITDHEHAKLMTKMQYDGIKQAAFFKAIMSAYVEDEVNIRRFIEENDSFKISDVQRKRHAKEKKRIALENLKLNLDKKTIDDILDILEINDE